MANRPNTRGIHKGERIDVQDYAWPQEFNLWSGLQQQMEGHRFVPPGLFEFLPDERYPTDRKVGPRGVPVGARNAMVGAPVGPVNPDRIPMLRGQAPPWAAGVRGNPGMVTPYPGR